MTPILGGRSLRRRIVLVVMLAMLAMLGALGAVGYYSITESVERSVQERLVLAQSAADYVDHVLAQHLARLHDLSARAGEPSELDMRAVRDAYAHSIFTEGVFGLDAAGRVVWVEPARREWVGTDLTRFPVFRRVMEQRRPCISDLGRVELLGKKVVAMMVPAGDHAGRPTAYVGGAVDPALSTLKEVISATRVGATGYTDVVDSQGAVLASSDTVRILTESNHGDFLANLIRDRRPTVATCHSCHKGESADKREREVVAFAPLVNAPWAVVVRQNEREALAPAKRLRERLLGIGLVLIGVALIIARATAQSVAKPIELLTGASRRIAEGNLSDPVPVVGGDEVGRLGQAFDRMRAQLKESMERIQNWNKELENRVRERTHQLEESEQNRSKLLRQVISVQEEERKRIARELHDETSQELSALVMGLEAARSGGLEDLKCGVEEAKSLAVRTLEGVHHIIFDLRPALLDDLGLQSAVRWYAEGHLEPLGMDVSLEFVGLERRLPTEVETTVFRVLQEAVNNVSAHSEAARVTLSMDFRERSIVVEIADDGRGFDPERTRGLGLMGMRERVTLLHGTFDLQSRPDKGTRIRFEVPTDVQD